MTLQNLQLMHFKSYTEASVAFGEQINCLVGENGAGKTNMLDAIHLLCLGRSAFAYSDQFLLQHCASFYMVKGEFLEEKGTCVINCAFQGGRKTLKADRKEYERMSDHLGRFPVVVLAPGDADLVREGSEVRRKYFDSLLCQLDKHYLQAIMRYSQALKQRNALLKQFHETNYINHDLLEPYNLLLLGLGEQIAQQRQQALTLLLPIFNEHYAHIAQQKEEVNIVYQSDTQQEQFAKQFEAALHKDVILQRTTLGIHRDDYSFDIGDYPLKKFGSQGQQKSFVMALKLAQFDLMEQKLGKKPLLLMDDIFDKLDDARIAQLLRLMSGGKFGQVFITDARPERSKQLLSGLNAKVIAIERSE